VTGKDNRNQMLLARSTDGGATFSAPVKVADYYDLPDCANYQNGADPGRACIPEKAATTQSIFRATNYPSGAVNPKNNSQIVITYGSYLNPNSRESNGCVPAGFSSTTGINLFDGVKVPGACNNKIMMSLSTDGGATFSAANTDPREATMVSGGNRASQWFQWTAFTNSGVLATSYYDRRYGADETTGASDISLSGSKDLSTSATTRVTSTSMPPSTQFSGLFWGDYAGLAVTDVAHPLWSDTRDPDLFVCPGTATPGVPPKVCTGVESAGPQQGMRANDEDIFTAALHIPTP
jgi:hypothetical protein